MPFIINSVRVDVENKPDRAVFKTERSNLRAGGNYRPEIAAPLSRE